MRLAPDIQGTFGRRDTESTRWRPEQGCYKQETTRSWERGRERMLPEAPDGALPCTAHTSSPDIQPLTCETKSFCCLSHDLWHFVTVALTKKNVFETSWAVCRGWRLRQMEQFLNLGPSKPAACVMLLGTIHWQPDRENELGVRCHLKAVSLQGPFTWPQDILGGFS